MNDEMAPMDGREEILSNLERRIEVLEHALRRELDEKTALDRELHEIKNSFAWLSILKYRGLRDWIFPVGTRRRRFYDLVKGTLRALLSPKYPRSNFTHAPMPRSAGEAFNTPKAEFLEREPAAKTFLGKKLEYRPSASSLKIACLTWTIPYPPDSGGKNRSYNLLRYLAQHHEVHLHVPVWQASTVPPALLDSMASITMHQLSYSFTKKSHRSRIIRGVPAHVAGLYTTQSVAGFQQMIAAAPADLILVDEAHLAPYAWPLLQTPCILMRQK